MKTFVRALVLALPFLAVPAEAQAWGDGCGSSGGFQICFGLSWNCWSGCGSAPGCGGPGPAQLAPWYTYWPYDAYFQVPAMSAYPYWPAPMTSSMQPPPVAPPPDAAHAPHQAVGYYPQSQWPTYWYGR